MKNVYVGLHAVACCNRMRILLKLFAYSGVILFKSIYSFDAQIARKKIFWIDSSLKTADLEMAQETTTLSTLL
jgi:hypothetical protein